ncbi:hypothetical protein JB92DRAFT_2832092 [Gautieria morchelliformis]|nr:hypothetical protein JB92DRAFT_2832092 [Gautieria morchelliformis]
MPPTWKLALLSFCGMFGTLPALHPTTTFNIFPLKQQLVRWFLLGPEEHSEGDDVETSLRLLFEVSESLRHFQLGQSHSLSGLTFSPHFRLEGHSVTAAATYKSLVSALIAAALYGNIGIKIENCINAWKDFSRACSNACMTRRVDYSAHSGAGVLQEEGQPSQLRNTDFDEAAHEAVADSEEEREADAYIVPS